MKGKLRIEFCGHAVFSSAVVLGVRFCLCRECGHRWQSWPMNLGEEP